MSVLQGCPSYRESNKESFINKLLKTESTVVKFMHEVQMAHLQTVSFKPFQSQNSQKSQAGSMT